MKNSIIQQAFLLLALTIILINPLSAQDDCKVLLEEIAGEYDGDCKKGLAEGQGTSKGIDTYVGDFKKGLPHGTGTYTWANGDIYNGEFEKGLKEGPGKMIVQQADGQSKEQTGFWSKDKYIGEYENPYKVNYKSPGVLSVRINETENARGEGPSLLIETQHKGKTQFSSEFDLGIRSGSYISMFPVGTNQKILVSSFPFGFTINYMGETIEIDIFQEASWNIIIDYNK